MYDVAIIGLGPAGSTLARLLEPHLKVVVIDKKDLTGAGGFHKPCGGLLAPDAQKYIAKFGLGLPLHILADPQIFTVRTIDIKANIEQYYQRSYLNFNRHKFDLWLTQLIPPHVEIIDQARCSKLEKIGDTYSVTYRKNGESHVIQTKKVIGADGAKSMVRDTFCPKPIRQYVCMQQSFPSSENVLPYFTCFFHPDFTDCYGWINVKDETTELGVALPKENPRAAFQWFLEYFREKGFPLENGGPIEACLVNRLKSVKEIELGTDSVLLIGEAAGFVSPSSLEGISYSMETAALLAPLLNNNTPHLGKAYHKATRTVRFRMFLKTLKVPFMYQPFLRKLVMKSGLASMKMYSDKKSTKNED